MQAAKLCECATCRRAWRGRLTITMVFHADLLIHTMHAFCNVLLSDVCHLLVLSVTDENNAISTPLCFHFHQVFSWSTGQCLCVYAYT